MGRGKEGLTARVALTALLSGAVGIAFAPIFVRLSEVGPVATAFYRLAFAVPLLWLWMRTEAGKAVAPRPPSTARDYRRLTAAGLFFAGDLAVWHWSLRFTSVANATLLANFAPVFVALGAWLFFAQRPNPAFLVGMATALAGATVLMGESVRLSTQHLFGDSLGLITAVFYAGYLLTVKDLRGEFSTATIMTWSGVVTGAALLPVAALSGEVLAARTVFGWSVMVGLAWVSHAGGQSLIAWALAHLPAPFSSVGLLLQPVAAALLAWVLLGEPLSLWQGIGGVVVLFGIALAKLGSRVS